MIVSPEFVPNLTPAATSPRAHPWGKTEYEDGGGRYHNFIEHPALIPEVLEDFKPHADRKAVQEFYDFLRWINGPTSNLETTDCALRAPHESPDLIFRKPLRVDGRVELLSREHLYNTRAYSDSFRWVCRMLCIYLQLAEPGFYAGKVQLAIRPTYYSLLKDIERDERFGYRLSLGFCAYGHTEDEAFDNLFILFRGVWKACERLVAARTVEIPEFP